MTQLGKIDTVKKAKTKKPTKMIKDHVWNKWITHSARTYADIQDVVPQVELPSISTGHQQILERTLSIKDFIQSNSGKSINQKSVYECRRLISELLDYATLFFDYEDKLLRELQVPTAREHITAHRELEHVISEVLNRFVHGKIGLSSDLYISLLDTILDHIRTIDVPSYRISNLKKFLNQEHTYDSLRPALKLSGIQLIDAPIYSVTSNILLAISDKKSKPEALRETVLSSLKEYISTEEQFLKECNNISNFSQQQTEHEELIEVAEDSESENDFKALLQQWLYHTNLLDFETHNFKNWSKITLQVTEELDDIEHIFKICKHDIMASHHKEILEFLIETPVLSDTSSTEESKQKFIDDFEKKLNRMFKLEEEILAFSNIHRFFTVSHSFEHKKIKSQVIYLRKILSTNRYRFSQNLKTSLIENLLIYFNYQDILLYGEER
ncbi:MAG: hemerythrin family protein [Oligoflexales bacterium]